MQRLDETRLGGGAALIGIVLVAVVSAASTWIFWNERGDLAAAWLTVGAEAVAIGGFVMVLHHWRDRRLRAVGGLFVTLLSGAWTGSSMFERLNTEAHERAVAAMAETDAYRQAQREMDTASRLYEGALRERVPAGLGPLTTDARRHELREYRAELRNERNQAQSRLERLTPDVTVDLMALLRGFGVQLATLLGLAVFGAGAQAKDLGAAKPKTEEEPVGPRPLTASELGKLGAAAKAAKRREKEEARLSRNAYMRAYRARAAGKWAPDLFGERHPDAPLH